jgi:hypothetical protein
MPVANTLREYLADLSLALPRLKQARKAVREIVTILEQQEREGGATYNLYFGDQFHEPFFAVALDNRLTQRLRDPGDLFPAIFDFLERNRGLLRHPRCCIGIWRGTDPDGQAMVFLDVTILVQDRAIARAFGMEGNQIAIFDLQMGVELDAGGTGLPIPGSSPPQERLLQLAEQDSMEISQGADNEDKSAG